jgi:DNA-binding protein HU-beta
MRLQGQAKFESCDFAGVLGLHGFRLTGLHHDANSAVIPIQRLRKSSKEETPLNKTDLVAKIADNAAITKRQAEAAFDAMVGGIASSLKKGQKVTIVGFGTFSVSKRKARMGRNPQTGVPIKIAARKVPKFTPGKALKSTVK